MMLLLLSLVACSASAFSFQGKSPSTPNRLSAATTASPLFQQEQEQQLISLEEGKEQRGDRPSRTVLVGADQAAIDLFGAVQVKDVVEGSNGRIFVDGRTASAETLEALSQESVSILVTTSTEDSIEELRDATKYEVFASGEDDLWNEISRLEALTRRASHDGSTTRKREVSLDFGLDTFFLSLTYESLDEPTVEDLAEFALEVDMLEIRVDLLACVSKSGLADSTLTSNRYADASRALRGEMARQFGGLRHKLRAAGCGDMPLLLTARSRNQCGALADRAEAVYALSAAALRAGVEWLDVEANWPALDTHAFVEWAAVDYPATRLLGSQHVVDADHDVGIKTAVKLLHKCALGGRADAVKLVVKARDERDSIAIGSAAAQADLDDAPCVAICLGDAGRLSRVLNRVMTPVTHRILKTAAPGQLDAKTLMALRRKLFLEPQTFGIVASEDRLRVAESLKSAHQAAFDRVGLPHRIEIVQNDQLERFEGVALLLDESASHSGPGRRTDLADAVGHVDFLSKGCNNGASGDRLSTGVVTQGDNALAVAISRLAAPYAATIVCAAVFGRGLSARSAAVALSSTFASVFVDGELKKNYFMDNPKMVQLSDEDVLSTNSNERFLAVVCDNSNDRDFSGAKVVLDARFSDEKTALQLPQDSVLIDSNTLLLELADQHQRLWTSRRPPRSVLAAALCS